MVGGYPEGRDWDLIRDEEVTEAEARAAVKLIGSLPIPARDPATGGPMTLWRDGAAVPRHPVLTSRRRHRR